MFPNRNASPVGAYLEVVVILMLMAGGFMMLVDGFRAYEAYTSQSWPSTKGQVQASRVETFGGSSGERSYRPYVRYGYIVDPNGENLGPFVSERIGPRRSERLERSSLAAEGIEPYPKEAIVDVYYNPNRPHVSMLEPSYDSSYLVNPIIGFLIFIGAIFLRFYIRRSGAVPVGQ